MILDGWNQMDFTRVRMQLKESTASQVSAMA
jgi:hypothetical protein